MWSIASGISNSYNNLKTIYNNIFPNSTVENISDWESQAFFFPLASLPTIAQRQARLVAKIRQTRGISYWDIATFIADFLPGVWVQVITFNDPIHGGWQLDFSPLNSGTVLNGNYVHKFNSGFGCTQSYWILGVSPLTTGTRLYDSDVANTTKYAYMYQVNIYDSGTTPTDTLTLLNSELNATEPARSNHVLMPGFTTLPFSTIVPNLTRFSNYAALKSDPTSTTGYTGAI
jgi:hypothetical protein